MDRSATPISPKSPDRSAIFRELVIGHARRSLDALARQNPLRWSRPPGSQTPELFRWTPKQLEAFERFAPGLLEQPPTYDYLQRGIGSPIKLKKIFGFLAGNRAGKSEWAARCFIAGGLGLNPARLHELPQDPAAWPLGPPRLLWGIMPGFERSRDTQQRFMWERVPPCLFAQRSTWNKKTGFHERIAVLANGTRLLFKSREQGLETFEGDPVHAVWVDEDVPLVYAQAALVRTTDYQGPLLWTCWPHAAEMRDLFVERRVSADAEPIPESDIGSVTATMFDNPWMSREEIERQIRLIDPSELAGRVHGMFSVSDELIYPDFDERIHVRSDSIPFPIPADWTRYEIIDPGWANPCAVEFIGVDERDVKGVYDEIYVRRHTVAEIAARIFAKRWLWAGRLSPSEYAEYMERVEKFRGVELEEQADELGSEAAARHIRGIKGLIDGYRRRCGECRPHATLIDEASAQRDQAKPISVLKLFAEMGIQGVRAANTERSVRRMALREWLRPIDGRLKFWVSFECRKVRWEFRHHRDKPRRAGERDYAGDREAVLEKDDHGLACLEYAAGARIGYVRPESRPPPRGSILQRMQEDAALAERGDDWRRRG